MSKKMNEAQLAEMGKEILASVNSGETVLVSQSEMSEGMEKLASIETLAPQEAITLMPVGYSAVKEIGKDEMREMMRRAVCEVEYCNKSENPSRTLTLSSELRRFVCAVLIKMPSRKASFVIGKEAPIIISAENIEADYLKFARAFESAAKTEQLCKLTTKLFIRADGTTFRKAYVKLANDAPFFAKEIKE